MQVKTYTGSSTKEVLEQIKAELGSEAVILGSKSFLKEGVRCHEMTAGVERHGSASPKTIAQQVLNAAEGNADLSFFTEASPANPVGWAEWHKEWSQIKEHIFALMKPSIQMDRLTPRQRVALEYLQREGISDVVALDLYRRLLAAPSASVLESLSELVPVRSWSTENWGQRIHCITGPYGVGKTTAALRMALFLRTQHPEIRIAFINADCHRGNGRLILRHWAELSDFSYIEAQDAASMEKAFVSNAAADVIFVDMPGLSRKGNIEELRNSLGLTHSWRNMASHLVLSPSYEGTQLAAFLRNYTWESEGSLVWSKLDEAVNYGSIVNVAAECHWPVSTLSYGAELRETLSPASESLLWRLIFKQQLPGSTLHNTAPTE